MPELARALNTTPASSSASTYPAKAAAGAHLRSQMLSSCSYGGERSHAVHPAADPPHNTPHQFFNLGP